MCVEFATVILSYMDQKGTKVTSPTLHRVVSRKRDLSMCLEEEKRNSLKSTKGSTAIPQYAGSVNHRPSSLSAVTGSNDGIQFVPLEGFYVLIEDAEGMCCPIYKEYPAVSTPEASNPFKVPKFPYPAFYWDSPISQCPFIPALATATNPVNNNMADAHKENVKPMPVPTKDSKPVIQLINATHQILPVRPILAHRVLRRHHMPLHRASLPHHPAAPGPTDAHPGGIVFEPAMTDTSILTAKTNMPRYRPNVAVYNAAAAGPQPVPSGLLVNASKNISISVNQRAAAALPENEAVPGRSSLRKPPRAPAAAPSPSQAAAAPAPAPPRPKPGFCECCCEKYSDLDRHVQTEFHRQFAQQSDNYDGIDVFLGTLKRSLKPEYLLAACKHNFLGLSGMEPAGFNDSFHDMAMVLPPKSPLSPTTTTSQVTAARNYTGTKRMKQSLASKRLQKLASKPGYPSSELSNSADEMGTLPAADFKTFSHAAAGAGAINPALLSSPSCKRRRILPPTGKACGV